ncbi:uroporphyrinogen-III synthase [Aliifodinibius sp. S!AR15-10]|uniref:uroporphyrinogen-III synthase n=1 Tax=Aliifodinibius sp. S!AR15-10 TaxID=2950437 RepID=UPI002865C47D|nr:uroporphyrinogen-III synthase [Aliifodinibius sp. S!AR15-10]MDR8394139.1 uroporphyrinogen-III synthase [Aliifodinibius sp. S!AR15-10]
MSTVTPLDNITALAFESRLANTTSKLLQRQGAKTISAPSMQEVPLETHTAVFEFSEQLFAGDLDILICMTGVGTDMMIKTMKTKYDWDDIQKALSDILLVSRGPKPAKVLRGLDIPIDIDVPEPNTWKEILAILAETPETSDLEGKRIAIQEYGEPNEKLNEELRKRGAELVQTSIYRWALPDDLEPLKNGIRAILDGDVDVVLFTSKTQIDHVMKVADTVASKEELREALNNVMVASIGPVCTNGLQSHGIEVDFEPTRPKLGVFINEIAERMNQG